MEGLAVLAVVLGLYFLPTIIAHQRGVTNLGPIAVINIFLGWTLVGWVVALAMAFRDVPATAKTMKADGFAVRTCPNCHRAFKRTATVCPHCGAESKPWIPHAGHWWTQTDAGRWQWLDEAAKVWRWYEDGTPSSPGVSDRTPSRKVDPAFISPPGATPQRKQIEVPAAGHSPAPSAELERLADLHTRGVLTDEEFQRAKQRVLDG